MNRWQTIVYHGTLILVVVNYLYVKSIAIFKSKTDAPLVIDSDTPLPVALVTERFEPVRGR